MAEFMNQKVEPEMSPIDRMGKPLPEPARQAAYEHCKRMGLNSARAWECVGGMAEQLERDKPYEAMQTGCRFLDLTGSYRVMAVLLTVEYK
jgi:hypothetical protein